MELFIIAGNVQYNSENLCFDIDIMRIAGEAENLYKRVGNNCSFNFRIMKKIKQFFLLLMLLIGMGAATASGKASADEYVIIDDEVFIKNAPGTPAGVCLEMDGVCTYELKAGETDWTNPNNLEPSPIHGAGFRYVVQ